MEIIGVNSICNGPFRGTTHTIGYFGKGQQSQREWIELVQEGMDDETQTIYRFVKIKENLAFKHTKMSYQGKFPFAKFTDLYFCLYF